MVPCVCSLLLSVLADQIHDGPAMKPGTEVYLQCAMVYTNGMLKRRIRVHTLAVPVSADIGVVFRHLDLDTVTNVMLKNGESSGRMFNKRDDFRMFLVHIRLIDLHALLPFLGHSCTTAA